MVHKVQVRCLIYTMCTENSSAMAPVYTFEQITECYISYFDNGISLRFEFDSGADFFTIINPEIS